MPPFLQQSPTPKAISIASSSFFPTDDDGDAEPLPHRLAAQSQVQVLVHDGEICYPRSQYRGSQSSPLVSERHAITELHPMWKRANSQDQYTIFKLDNFSVYRSPENARHGNELCPLNHLKVETGAQELLVDGTLEVHGQKKNIQAARFECLTLEGYGNDDILVPSVCIQTEIGNDANVWYELCQPANEYRRYYRPFLWLSCFAKYVVDYLENSENVTLTSFRRAFHLFITRKHGHLLSSWLDQYRSNDFRQAFCANVGFLFKEIHSVNSDLLKHPIWREADPINLKAIPKERLVYDKTIVTPFIRDMFKEMPFYTQLQVLAYVDPVTTQKQSFRRAQMKLTPIVSRPTRLPQIGFPVKQGRKFRPGDVVSVAPETNGKWKASAETQWYAYVQAERTHYGRQRLDVLWLYQPADTTLSQGYYPWQNELFMSDNCSCGDAALNSEDIVAIIPVRWYVNNPEEDTNSFFVRQKFWTEHALGAYDFVQLHESDFRCSCETFHSDTTRFLQNFKIGDTVLVRQNMAPDETLEPATICGFSSGLVKLQKFLRNSRDLDESGASQNQITSTSDMYVAEPEDVIRKCTVACFKHVDAVTPPYNLDGAGDFFFTISTSDSTRTPDPSQNPPEGDAGSINKLRGMGIFCGGGSMDRGLEEGGGVAFKYGVDLAEHALHSYRANIDDPNKVHLFLGSVNDYIAKALQGSKDKKVAQIGDVDLLAAGSPCPGFSVLQPDKNSLQSLRNCSLVASVCTYVDLYAPKYLILENVVGIARTSKDAKHLNVFSQVLCCLVALGYQTQQYLMDPSAYGSCQSRQRVFIVATAPECIPPDVPSQTHESSELRNTAIGRASNGLPFGSRRYEICPFKSSTAQEAFKGLPDISDGHVQICIPFPDHRSSVFVSSQKRQMIRQIPTFPYGRGFMQAVQMGKMSQCQIDIYPWRSTHRGASNSKSYSRLYPNKLIGCLTTSIKPHDAFVGRTLHWQEHRLMSVMEARRTQSIPDHEVVIGNPTQQWKIIGNGVDRKVSFAIGLQIAKAWKKTFVVSSAELVPISKAPTVPIPMYDSSSDTAQETGASTVSGKRSKSSTTLTRATSLSDGEAISTAVYSKRRLSSTGNGDDDDDDNESTIVVKHKSLKETVAGRAYKRPRLSSSAKQDIFERGETGTEQKQDERRRQKKLVHREIQIIDLTGD